MLIKAIIIAFLIFVFASLGTGLYYLVKDESRSSRTVKALSIRIGISLALFILLMVAYFLGWLTPNTV